jgi:serine/threonine protein phosphatase PrpC
MVEVAVRLANAEVCDAKTPERERMGSTLSLLLLRNQHAIIGHLGDSRIYRLRRGRLVQLTRDHSFCEELRKMGSELPPRAEFAWSHMITRALGMAPTTEPDVHSDAVYPGDLFLLCTDGLTGALSAAHIQEVLGTTPTSTVCDRLVREAYEAGSRDNITAVVVRVLGVG